MVLVEVNLMTDITYWWRWLEFKNGAQMSFYFICIISGSFCMGLGTHTYKWQFFSTQKWCARLWLALQILPYSYALLYWQNLFLMLQTQQKSKHARVEGELQRASNFSSICTPKTDINGLRYMDRSSAESSYVSQYQIYAKKTELIV